VRVTPICIGDDRVTLLEGEGEPMATVGAKAVERGEGEAICTDGGVGDAPHPPPEGVREMGVGKSCCGEGAVRRRALGLGQSRGRHHFLRLRVVDALSCDPLPQHNEGVTNLFIGAAGRDVALFTQAFG